MYTLQACVESAKIVARARKTNIKTDWCSGSDFFFLDHKSMRTIDLQILSWIWLLMTRGVTTGTMFVCYLSYYYLCVTSVAGNWSQVMEGWIGLEVQCVQPLYLPSRWHIHAHKTHSSLAVKTQAAGPPRSDTLHRKRQHQRFLWLWSSGPRSPVGPQFPLS